MKKIAKILLMIMLYETLILPFTTLNTEALTTDELASRNVCGNKPYELAVANIDGSITTNSCYTTYNEAKNMMNHTDNDDSIILERSNNVTKVIDAKYAIVDLNRGEVLTYYYQNPWDTTSQTYMNNSSTYGGVDAAYLGIDWSTKAIKVKIANYTGWVKNGNYKIIPLAWVKMTNYYDMKSTASDNNIWHCYVGAVDKSSKYSCRSFDRKPTMLADGRYYSYDGIYFYKDRKAMLQDYMNGNHNQAANKNEPYYNYYMYLPHHSKTTYSSRNMDEYLRNIWSPKMNATPYGGVAQYGSSEMYGQGAFYYYAQQVYGINALLSFSVSQNESGTGTSRISIDKKNGFGHGAVDSDAYGGANGYISFAYGIFSHAAKWWTYGYTEASDYRYHGGVLGNKGIGANINWASDPYWSEKAASFYYDFDVAYGRQDYNYYQLGQSTASNVSVRATASNSGKEIYKLQEAGIPLLLVGEVRGDFVNGDNIWYKITSDLNIDGNKNIIPYDDNNRPIYDWKVNYVYVPRAYVTKINTAKSGYQDPNAVYPYKDSTYQYEYFLESGSLKPIIGKTNKQATVYYDSTLEQSKGYQLKQNKNVLIHAVAKDQYGNHLAYLVVVDPSKNQREWICSSDITITNTGNTGKIIVDVRGESTKVYNTPGGNTVGDLYTDTWIVIVGSKVVNGTTWLQIEYNLTSSTSTYVWIPDTYSNGRIEYKISKPTHAPVIHATDKLIKTGSIFNALEGVTASDEEDGNLTSKIKVTENTVNTKVPGTYYVTYQVTDSEEKTVTKRIKVTVSGIMQKEGFTYFQSFNQISNDIFEISGFLGVAHVDNKKGNTKHTLILQNMDTKEETKLPLNAWDGAFEMTNRLDDKAYDYSGGWFKSQIDLKNIPQGDYVMYVEIENGIYKSRELFTNVFYSPMVHTASSKTRSYVVEVNYYKRDMPLEIFIRNEALIAKKNTPTEDRMFNFFEELSFTGDTLKIKGTSYNIGVDYGISKNVERSIILENTKTFERKIYNVSTITNGGNIVMRVPDGLSKAKAWYIATLNIADLEKGTYVIYAKTKVDNIEDYGELRDLMYSELNASKKIGNKTYSIKRNDDQRFRIELVVS